MEHKGSIVLETERLILRPFREEDAQEMFDNWASNPNVTKYVTWPPHTSVEATKSLLREWGMGYFLPDFYQWAIELKELGQVIGNIAVVNIDEKIDACEIGYCLGEAWWNKGIATEAFKRVIDFLFAEVQANRISARHDTDNPASGKVMQKSGLVYEGTLRQAGKNNTNPLCDLAIYAILREMGGWQVASVSRNGKSKWRYVFRGFGKDGARKRC